MRTAELSCAIDRITLVGAVTIVRNLPAWGNVGIARTVLRLAIRGAGRDAMQCGAQRRVDSVEVADASLMHFRCSDLDNERQNPRGWDICVRGEDGCFITEVFNYESRVLGPTVRRFREEVLASDHTEESRFRSGREAGSP